jgi:ABC-type phosphate/phosphonate transport system substrate-binding protein
MKRACVGTIVAALICGGMLGSAAAQTQAPEIRIGVIQSLFRDIPEPMVPLLLTPFKVLLKNQTGMTGVISRVSDAENLGKQLNEGKVDFAVFHGFELAWAQQKYPNLKPLMIAVNKHRLLYAHLIVRNDSTAAALTDLRGTTFGVPFQSKEHCRLFLERQCEKLETTPDTFFDKVVRSPNIVDALDDVLRGKLAGTVVDGTAWEAYGSLKPGCWNRLKCIHLSDAFPAPVVAYKQNGIDPSILKRFNDGMLAANNNIRGRELLNLWRLSAFEPIPPDYQQTLDHILGVYPPPETPTAVHDGP